MSGETDERRSFGWALPASAIAHAAFAALLIVGLPISLPEPQADEAVNVTLVEQPPEPPPPTQAQEEPAQPPAAAAKAPEASASQDSAAARPMRTLNSVVKFGESDAGPREALTGASASDSANDHKPSPLAETAHDVAEINGDEARGEPAQAKVLEPTTEVPEIAESDNETEAPKIETATGQPELDEIEQPKSDAEDGVGAAPSQLTARSEATEKVAQPAPDNKPSPEPASAPKANSAPKLAEARTLFSRSANRGSTATTAMANIPRGLRGGQLCATELRLQLQNGANSYAPRALPSYDMKDSNVLKVQHGVFLTSDGWYSLAFECQVDPEATEVRSFALRVGDPLSAQEIAQRGLPTR